MMGRATFRGLLAVGFSALLTCAASAADLTIAMPNWASGQASANILKVGIKQALGLDADVVEMGTLIAFNGLDTGKVDVHPEVWLPNLNNLVDRYVKGSGTVTLSPVSVPAWQGICANRTAADKIGIKDIADLSDPKKTVALDTNGDGKGELWIGAETWSSTAIERVRANSYGYAKNLDLLEMPEDVGMAAVDAAEAVEKPIVFACYAPSAVFKLHQIVRLTEPPYDPAKWKIVLPSEDPAWLAKSSADVGWDAASYRIAYASSLKQRHPDVVRFLEHVDFTPDEAIDMSYALQVERKEPLAYAEQWVKDHADRVKGWAKQ
ncbi:MULTISPECIES: glycine betaine ABC transporter substrate-binding protein [Mesorhizobium]|uniref:Amino acid-binding protein n=1 Tax=Mesorhizobium denitrificans TaxID=2294114 RepID=A0A371XJF3_9HYPH|nr:MULTISPECIES: glycine betaine ABC transporter substrate-binding protein [Mesorhizobium]RFC69356.1 amino acid-binding protein [Mesorhizobium denitrificans]